MSAPQKIWIATPGKELPDWIVERLVGSAVAADGSFEIEASDGQMKVQRGFAIFMFNEQVFACPPSGVQAKLASVAGDDDPAVAELQAQTETTRDRKQASRVAAREAPLKKAAGDKPLNIKPMIGEPPSPQFASLERLHVDDTYQRSIEGGASQKLIVKIAENWDWRLCLPLLVSRRGSELFVIDGQHRLEAARMRGDIQHMPVVVFDFDDPRAEAELFVSANRSRRPMSKLDDFHAAVAAGDKKSTTINRVVVAAGLVVGRNQAWQMIAPGEVIFVGAIQSALRVHSEDTVITSLTMMALAYEGLVITTGAAMFESLCLMIKEGSSNGKPLDQDMMVAVLREVGMVGWKEAVAAASNGYERSELMLTAMRTAYAEAEGEE